jgi:hypothetical protein
MAKCEYAKIKNKSARKDAETQGTRKDFLCVAFASSRLCVKAFAFCKDFTQPE